MQGGVTATSRPPQGDVNSGPGHEAIAGNERANELLRRGSGTPLQELDPTVGVAGCQVKTEVAEWVDGRHRSLLGSTSGMRQTKALSSRSHKKITD